MAIQDFGKKIGGARKDLWAARGLQISDIEDFNLAERAKYITKNNVWPKPDYEKLLNEGYSRTALYFIKAVRDSIPTSPELSHFDTDADIERKQNAYINFISSFKETMLEVKTNADISKIGIQELVDEGYVEKRGSYSSSYSITAEGEAFITNKFFKALQMSASQAERESIKKGFLADNINSIKGEFGIYEIDGSFSNEDAWWNKEGTAIKRERYGGTDYFYPAYQEVANYIKNIDIQDYRGNFLIVRQNRILGMTHDYQEAQQFVEKQAQAIFDKKEADKEAAKEAGKADPDRKKGLTPPILAHIERTGPEMRVGNVVGDDFLNDFKIKGGEFGNWLNESERQTNMNMAYDSFKDMAKALGINDADISMGGKLNIAFGSRGRKGAAAHYEPLREVINLTKMKGAGSLAHEMFHAMDDIAGKEMGFGDFATAHTREKNAFTELVQAMKYKEVTLSAEELNKEAIENADKRADKLRQEIVQMVPDRILTPELIEQRDKLIDDLFAKLKDPEFKFREMQFGRTGKVKFTINEAPIKDISAFIDANSKNYRMNERNKQWLSSNLESVQGAYNSNLITEPITRRVETEFYKNSKKMDDTWSKTTNGYWQSNIEMAARAFACYLHDKMKEMGIKNDYLTGHAFQKGMNSKGEVIPVYPTKEEREVINKAFDKVIEEMKSRGIFHQREENQLAAETEHGYVVVERTESAVNFTVMDKDFNEVVSAQMPASANLHAALKTAAAFHDKGSDITEIDYSVFEAKKAQRQEELAKEAQQKALRESMNTIEIDSDSCEQLSLYAFLDNQEPAKVSEAQTTEPAKNNIADLQAEIDKLSKQYQVHTDAIKETNKRLAEIRNAMQEEGISLFATDNPYSAERKELHKYNEVNKDAAFEIQQQIKELNQKINDIKAEQERQNNQAVYEAAPEHKRKQLDIVLATNPMNDDYHVGIRSVEDIKTFEEAIQDDESFAYGDFDREDAEKALKIGMVTVYSSYPIDQGGFVSTSYNMAKDYAGNGKVYAERVSINDVAWINGDEGQFAKVPEREIQRKEPSKSKRKSDRDER